MREKFFHLLGEQLLPELREACFAGRPWKLRRKREPFWDCIEIQRSSSGEHCYLNLGTTLSLFSNWEVLGSVRFDTLRVVDCEFETRLSPPNEVGWLYGTTAAEALDSVERMVTTFKTAGRQWFERYSTLPGPFAEDQPEEFSNSRNLLVRALIFDYCRDWDRALRFAARIGSDIHFGEAAEILVERIRKRQAR